LLLVFFHESVSPQPQSIPLRPFQIFSKIHGDSQGAPSVSTTPWANFSTIFASVVDTGGKFATDVKDPSSKFFLNIWWPMPLFLTLFWFHTENWFTST
jgi:hypothetical protein